MRVVAFQRGITLRLAGMAMMSLAFLSGCQSGSGYSGAESGTGKIEGNVVYLERMLLLPGAELEVKLVDVSRADAPSEDIASVKFPVSGGPPFLFQLEYDRADMRRGGRYTLEATITGREGLRLVTNEPINPFGEPPVEVLVRGVPR
ncbi:MAG: hypothetical protein Hals2KO_40810 [Halioglobus sp.]